MIYTKSSINKLKIPFSGVEKIERNFSQSFQDMFVITMLRGKKNGIYVEIGGSEPININNTFLLESVFGWRGISFEIDPEKVKVYNSQRKNNCICADATNVDYSKVFTENNFPMQIDYLQIDIEPAWQTLKALKKIDLNLYRFSVITFETDAYQGNSGVISESRSLLTKHGYQLVASNVKDEGNAFEDWYIDPQVISSEIWKKFQSDNLDSSEIIFHSNGKNQISFFKNNIYSFLKKKYIVINWYRWQLWSKFLDLFVGNKFNGSSKWVISKGRSMAYLSSCKRAAMDDSFFSIFKRDPGYTHVLEHVSFEEGLKYLDDIKISFKEKLDAIKENDQKGSPFVFDYPQIGLISPTTIRYIKNSSDIVSKFGTGIKKIVEIGGGYGGLCKVLSSFVNFERYHIIDLDEVNLLTRKYLSHFNLPVFSFRSDEIDTENEKYDLLISNYAFSECVREVQLEYIEKFIRKSERFYMMYNNLDKMNIQLDEFITLLSDEFEIQFYVENGLADQPKVVYGIKL